jgi:hypothetical protein
VALGTSVSFPFVLMAGYIGSHVCIFALTLDVGTGAGEHSEEACVVWCVCVCVCVCVC